MLKEYQESLDKQTREQNIKFSNIENNQKKLEKQNEEIINWINSQSKNKQSRK